MMSSAPSGRTRSQLRPPSRERTEDPEKKAAQIIQLDVGQCGGITEAKKIAGIAEAHYAMIAPHMACGPIAAASAIQIDTCSPNFLIQESIQNFTGFFADVLKKPIQWEDGYIIPPTDPGIGYELDEAVVEANQYEGDGVFPPMGSRDRA